jgi:dipeptidyl aminopeptidase/acylaminoacyl peptidase
MLPGNPRRSDLDFPWRIVAVLVTLITGLSFARSGQPVRPTFTLDQILSAPFPTDLVASPADGKLAWVFNDRGIRNIWVAEPPNYVGRKLTSYTEDDGQELTGLEWSGEGKTLVFVRAGAERGEEYPNPRSSPKGPPEQSVWIVSLDKPQPRSLGEGHAPKTALHSQRVVYLKKGQVWWAPLDGSAKPVELFRARGQVSSLRWSPDGSKLAFVSNRRDHGFVGVYDWEAKTVRWLDPSVDMDSNPVWSPDGKQVAFLRMPTSRSLVTRAFEPRRIGTPWSIRVADVSSGVGHAVWTADKGRGSVFHSVAAEDQLWWGDDHIVFPWEKDGWTHLYSIGATGGTPVPLTPGEFEVEHVSATKDRKNLLFSSNQRDIDRRHLWSVPLAGGQAAAITQGKGIEWSPVATSDGQAMAYFHSDARRPGQPAVKRLDSSPRDLAANSIPADFPESALVEPQPVLFPAADGMTIHGQLFLPPEGNSSERKPAVVFFHGGSRRQMLLGWHYMYYYHNCYALNQYLASRGYVVLSANYRSGIGYGLDFREALNYGAGGASEFNDVQGAGMYLRSRPDLDPKRVGLWGGSYGGYLTALGLSRASDLFAAGVDIHGVYDWNATVRNFMPAYDPRAEPDQARLAHESSPIASVKNWRSPVLVIHGDDDRNVPFSESVHLVEDLRKQGVEVEQLIFPDEVHDFLTHEKFLQAEKAAADFFDRRLKGK